MVEEIDDRLFNEAADAAQAAAWSVLGIDDNKEDLPKEIGIALALMWCGEFLATVAIGKKPEVPLRSCAIQLLDSFIDENSELLSDLSRRPKD